MSTHAVIQRAKKELALGAYQMLTFLGSLSVASIVAAQSWGIHLGWKTAILTAVGTYSLLVFWIALRDLFKSICGWEINDDAGGFFAFILAGVAVAFFVLLGFGISDAIPYIRTVLGWGGFLFLDNIKDARTIAFELAPNGREC